MTVHADRDGTEPPVDPEAALSALAGALDTTPAELADLRVELTTDRNGLAACKVWRVGTMLFDGVSRAALLAGGAPGAGTPLQGQLAARDAADTLPAPTICPECAQGKHGICAGEALDPVTDEVVGCQCEEDC